MLKVFVGNEPYMVDYQIKKLSQEIMFPDFNLLKADSLGESVSEFLDTFPIMEEKRCAVVNVKNLKELESSFFTSLLKKEQCGKNGNIVLIVVDDYDKRTSLYKELVKGDFLITYDKTVLVNKVPACLVKRAASLNVSFADGVVEEMLKRCGYVENEECNLYTLFGYVNSMAPLAENGIVTMNVMTDIVPSYFQSDTFGLAKLICAKDLTALAIQAQVQRGNEIPVLSALLREYRIAYKAVYYSLKEIGVTYSPFLKRDKEYLLYGLNLLTDTIAGIKGGTVMEATCLMGVFLKLCSFGNKGNMMNGGKRNGME